MLMQGFALRFMSTSVWDFTCTYYTQCQFVLVRQSQLHYLCSPEAVQIKAPACSSRVSTHEHEQWALPGGYAYSPGDMHIPQETHRANEPLSLRWRGEWQAEQLWQCVDENTVPVIPSAVYNTILGLRPRTVL